MRQRRKMQSISRHTLLPLNRVSKHPHPSGCTLGTEPQGRAPGPRGGAHPKSLGLPHGHPKVHTWVHGPEVLGPGWEPHRSQGAATANGGPGMTARGQRRGPGHPAAAHPGLKPMQQTVIPLALSLCPPRGLGGQAGVTRGLKGSPSVLSSGQDCQSGDFL